VSEKTRQAEIEVTGMHCQSCVALIEESLTDTAGVHAATVDLEQARAFVSFDPAQASIDVLCAAIVSAGYGAAPATERVT
jgi:P-type Cu+ transporter